MTMTHLFDFDSKTKDNDELELHTPVSVESSMLVANPPYRLSEKQLAWLRSMFVERDENIEAMEIRKEVLAVFRAGEMTKAYFDAVITELKEIPKNQHKAEKFEHGQIWLTKDHQFVKVTLNQLGTFFYGSMWSQLNKEWRYIGASILNSVDHLCTAEEAKEWSEQWEGEYKFCVFCMRHLGDPRSVQAGYGERCSQKHNLPWG